MMKNTLYGMMAGLLLVLAACTTDPHTDPNTQGPGTQPATAGELLVKFDPYVSEILERATAKTRNGEAATRSGILTVDEVLELAGGYEIERVFPVNARTEAKTRNAGLHLWYVIRFDGDRTEKEVAEQLAQLGEVQKVSLNHTIKRAYDAEKKAKPLDLETLRAMALKTRAADFPYNDPQLPAQ